MAQADKTARVHKPVGTDISTARRVSRLRRHTRLRKPDPYKGKGVRYQGEVVKRKVGKTGK